MPDDPMRAAFENTFDPHYQTVGWRMRFSVDGKYVSPRTQLAWQVWQAAVAWERERPAREHAALPKCPECGDKVAIPGDELCQPCMFRRSCSDYDRVPLEPAGSVEVKYVEGGPMLPVDTQRDTVEFRLKSQRTEE